MFTNSTTHYGWVAIILHWLVAVTVIGLFAVGVWMVELDYYSSWYRTAPDLHKSTGICLALVMLFRVFWRWRNPKVESLETLAWKRKAAHSVHMALMVIIGLIIISGYLISTEDGRGIAVFDLFEVPALGQLFEQQADIAGVFHEYAAYLLIALVVAHAGAALKHHFIDKDSSLKRMLGRK